MKNNLPKMILDNESIKLSLIYQSTDLKNYKYTNISNSKIKEVYGTLDFPELPINRPFLFSSLVSSIDGKIAYEDKKEGPLIAKLNAYDETGALADWWVLNLLRTYCDGIFIGTNTLKEEKEFTGHIFDENLEDLRSDNNLPRIPYNIITSLNATDIVFDHIVFTKKEIPIIISTSLKAKDVINNNLKKDFIMIELQKIEDINPHIIDKCKNCKNKIIVILTGNEIPDTKLMLYFLKKIGLNKVLVETPGFAHHLIEQKVLDELFINYSCVYIGGKALSIGQTAKSFSSKNHPHTKVLSIHSHSDHFFYFRHKFIYD